ncbi:flagellar basal body-associated FliL family protein [bacterium]|nr:flagellar basal body-associated FliL family protein [bacterium]
MAEAPSSPEGAAAEKPAGPGPLGLIAVLVNTVAILSVMGLVIYTRILYKRPKVTEHGERARLEEAKATPAHPLEPGTVQFEPLTVNIQSVPGQPRPLPGAPQEIRGKFHYVTLGFALELRDISLKDQLEIVRPVLVDRVISLIGRKSFSELVTVQGRYLVKTQILDQANALIQKSLNTGKEPNAKKPDAFVTNVFFTHFIVQ